MTESEIVELGVRSDLLLTSKTFRFVVERLGEGYADNILTSGPHEQWKREDNYNKHRALNDIVSQLAAYVQMKDDIVERAETADREQKQANDE